jgi:integrase
MRVDELSSDGTVWTLPATRTKNKRTHTITLPPLAREIIASVKRGDRYVFTRNGRPLNGFSNAKNRLDAHMVGVPAWRTHDLRRVAVTGMARAGADLHVIERVINHASGSFGGIVGVYQKHKFADESARALAAWERLLLSIVEPAVANVVSLRG